MRGPASVAMLMVMSWMRPFLHLRARITLLVATVLALVLVQVSRSECLYSECQGWGSAGTARAIGLALRRAQGQPEAGIRSVDYCLEHKSAPHDAGPADWNSLVRFVETGGSCRARERRPTRAG